MTEPTREEKCRVLAEWLDWKWNAVCPYKDKEAEWTTQHDNGCWTFIENGHAVHGERLPDFYTSEEASALLLEKGRFSIVARPEGWTVGHQWMNGTVTMWASGAVLHVDRKTAIAEAAFAFVMRGKLPKQ